MTNAEFMTPVLEFAFEARVSVDDGWHVGRGADEQLHVTPITGGTVDGPLLNGIVLALGADWSVKRGDTTTLEARYLLQTDDGAVIDILNRGYYRADPELERRMEDGENIPESKYYFRTAPVMQTDAPQYRWLAENQFIGMARDEDGQICIRFFVLR
ncbi:DUF3237 domain-containing protein [Rhodococcus sp. IEGM1428]|uniref:DUF3237 domain-containing protein n=1 Tax=Rhodococcus sp. IEGM1428 TaxID=3392191 RepID=UPI003D0DB985